MSMGYNPDNKSTDPNTITNVDDANIPEIDLQKMEDKFKEFSYDFSIPFDENSNQNVDSNVEFIKVTCPSCFKESDCRVMTVKTPFVKELLIMCQLCEFCNYRTTEVKTGGEIKDKGTKITIYVDSDHQLKLDLFKSNTCIIKIPELDFEYESFQSEGSAITTVQGLMQILVEVFNQKLAV